MRSVIQRIVGFAVALSLGHGVTEAAPIQIGLAFEASDFVGFLGTTPPQDSVSGTFFITFDYFSPDTQIFAPDFVDLTIDGFTYGVTDTTVFVNPGLIVIGGAVGGVFSMSSGTDDFELTYDRYSAIEYFSYATSSSILDIYSATTVAVTGASVPPTVPEPSTVVLLGGGALALLANRWRRRGRTHLTLERRFLR